MAEPQTPEEVEAKAAADKAAAIKRMEESVPVPTQAEIDKAVSGGEGEEVEVVQSKTTKKTMEASPTPSTYQTKATKADKEK